MAKTKSNLLPEQPEVLSGERIELKTFIPHVMREEGYQHLDILNVYQVFERVLGPYMDATRQHPDYDMVHSVLAVVEWLSHHHPEKLFDYSYDSDIRPKLPREQSGDQFGDIALYMRADAGLEPKGP